MSSKSKGTNVPGSAGGEHNPQVGKTISADTGGGPKGTTGRQVQHGLPDREGSRGHSIQGPKQDARGGPDGANQGGAPRGGSRVEPSHQHEQQKKDRVTHKEKSSN